jgi:hypothetical protein
MSLAITAATFDYDDDSNQNNSNNNSLVNKKRRENCHNKTQKRNIYNFDENKVNSVLKSIHNSISDDEDNNLGDIHCQTIVPQLESFKPLNPLDPPKSVGTERTKEGIKENFSGKNNYSPELAAQPVSDNNYDLQTLQSAFMNDQQVKDYYKRLLPNFNPNKMKTSDANKNYYNMTSFNPTSNANSNGDSTNALLLEKLNYMINLLEEQQDEKTNNVAEEVILYSFLGIFIIFVVDSFARVGKYVR